jgi:hypothetical protein
VLERVTPMAHTALPGDAWRRGGRRPECVVGLKTSSLEAEITHMRHPAEIVFNIEQLIART